MPSTQITRPGRPSAHGKKRPASPHAESSRPKAVAPVVPPKRVEPVYFEDDYRGEVLAYMTLMDVSVCACTMSHRRHPLPL